MFNIRALATSSGKNKKYKIGMSAFNDKNNNVGMYKLMTGKDY